MWSLRPGALVGTLTVIVTKSAEEQRVLRHIHSVFEANLGHCHLTVQVSSFLTVQVNTINDNYHNKHAYAGIQRLFYTSKSPIGTPGTAALRPSLTSVVEGRGCPPFEMTCGGWY